jgi:hypothetical protein
MVEILDKVTPMVSHPLIWINLFLAFAGAPRQTGAPRAELTTSKPLDAFLIAF